MFIGKLSCVLIVSYVIRVCFSLLVDFVYPAVIQVYIHSISILYIEFHLLCKRCAIMYQLRFGIIT